MRELALLSDLVATPSETGNEQLIANYVETWYRHLGHEVTRLDDSLVAYIPGRDASRAFIESGHLDTVPRTDQWLTDPFTLQTDPTDPDRVVGLGASDMKSGLAVMMVQAADMADSRPPTDQYHVFTSYEESDQRGVADASAWLGKIVKDRYKTAGGIILEPTRGDYVAFGHRGDTNWHITATGDGGHGSYYYDDPAIERIGVLLSDLRSVRREWSERYSHPVLGEPIINATINEAGSAPNVVPITAYATLNLRVTPGMLPHLDQIRSDIAAEYGLFIYQSYVPRPTFCNAFEHIYRTARRALPHTLFQTFFGATEMPFYHSAGIPMLVHGPGDDTKMHKPDESTSIADMASSRRMLDSIIAKF